MKKKIVAALVVGAVSLSGIAACDVSDDSGSSGSTKPETTGPARGFGSKDAARDVKLGKMSTTFGTIEIPVTVVNHSSKASDYHIEATVYSADGTQIDTASTYISRLTPGGKARDSLIGMNGDGADHYKLTVVDRTASY